MRFLTSPRTLLPMMISVGIVIVGLRANDVWEAASSGRLFARQALAETASASSAPASTTPAPAAGPKVTPPSMDNAAAAKTAPADQSSATDIPIPEDASPAEMEVLKQLSNRHQELDKRAKELDTREALIKVAEQRVDQKIQEMETLRKQLQTMVNQVSETQAAQLDNLVKIYETMKPKDAARIFEDLDMPILLSVIQRMKPARTAPIMAEMNPDKAKEVTTALTKQDKLPQAK